MHVRLIDYTAETYKGIEATVSALTVYICPPEEGGEGKGGDDRAGKMMGWRCPSPTSEDEQLRPGAVDKESCSAQDHKDISSFILHLPWISTAGATEDDSYFFSV